MNVISRGCDQARNQCDRTGLKSDGRAALREEVAAAEEPADILLEDDGGALQFQESHAGAYHSPPSLGEKKIKTLYTRNRKVCSREDERYLYSNDVLGHDGVPLVL